jgi:hypothetical protein
MAFRVVACLVVGVVSSLLLEGGVGTLSAQGSSPPAVSAAESRGPAVGYGWYEKKVTQWESQARLLRTLQVLFVVLAVVSSILAASRIKLPAWWPEWLLPVIAAVAVALFAGLDINSQANKQRQAWRHLSEAMAAYRDGAESTLDSVRKAYGEAEEMIGDYNPQVRK